MISNIEDSNDVPYLSDILIRGGGVGQPVLEELEAMESEAIMSRDADSLMKWKLKVIRDEWGNPPRPGDKVIKINKLPLNKRGKSLPPDELNLAMLDGSYAKRFEKHVPYTIDEKGCIECSFTDAGYFLIHHGIHGKTERTMNTKEEHSTEPVDAPNGSKIHVWYWRFMEVDAEDYKNLPKLKKTDEPKRGLDPVAKIRAWDKAHAEDFSASPATT
jgi:hypothetical protein